MNDAKTGPHWIEHESRAAILAELHARPFLPLKVPRRIYHFAFEATREKAAADRAAIAQLARDHGLEPPAPDAKFHYLILGDWRLRWEQHTEFATYTWSTSLRAEAPFQHPDPVASGEIAFRQPGPLIVATHLCVLGDETPLEDLAALFKSQSLCVIGIGKESAHAFADFAVDGHGFTRMALRVRNASPMEAGRLAQRIMEVETYRTMALLGLPMARAVSPELRAMESELSDINHSLNLGRDSHVNHDLLRRLSDLLVKSEALATRTAFRFGASRAYHALVKNRLELLQERKEGQYPTISNFLSARLDPAIETCNAVETRQNRLSTDVARTTNLMRTGITLDMERQNGALLDDMVRRTRLQMRYLVGLFAFVAKGLKEAEIIPAALSAEMMDAISVPFAILIAWAFMARVRLLSDRAAQEEKID